MEISDELRRFLEFETGERDGEIAESRAKWNKDNGKINVAEFKKYNSSKKIEDFLLTARALRPFKLDQFNEVKREHLQETFRKFSQGGRQDISDYEPLEVGSLYENVYRFYQRRVDKLC